MSNPILLAYLWSPPSFAKKRKPTEIQTSTAPADNGEGTLYDRVEPAEPSGPDDGTTADAPTEELVEEQDAADSWLHTAHVAPEAALAFLQDPMAATADDPLHLAAVDPSEFDIPVVVNDEVTEWMEYFLGKGRPYYERWLSRKTSYEEMISAKLTAAKLPQDLIYLSMIESGFGTHATSRTAAVGLWQFMPGTARDYGLRVDSWVDDRREPLRATDAALALLDDLHDRYDDWYLAWAAYNAGPGRVNQAVAAGGTKDFWTIAERGLVKDETANYVPKLLAAAIIGHHPERYGFTTIPEQPDFKADVVTLDGGFSADVLAQCAGTDQDTFGTLNPHLRQGAVPPGTTVRVNVPVGDAAQFLAAVEKVPAEQRITLRHHTVRKGESLGTIAQTYGVSMGEIQTANGIRNPNQIPVGAVLVIPAHGAAVSKTTTSLASAPAKPASTAVKTVAATTTVAKTTPKPSPAASTKHLVGKGETLTAIAASYDVSVSDLLKWNHIANANDIRAGQSIVIYASWSSYSVRKGDTLSTIAQKNACSVDQIKDWNHLNTSTIYVGQHLKIRGG